MDQLEKMLADFFGTKAPQLPANIRQFIAKVSPYLAVIAVVLALPAILFVLGLNGLGGSIYSVSGSWGSYGGGTLAIIFALISIVLYGLAIPGLFKRTIQGWRYAYWSVLVGGIESLVMGNFFGLIIGTGISLYIWFQIRSLYHGPTA